MKSSTDSKSYHFCFIETSTGSDVEKVDSKILGQLSESNNGKKKINDHKRNNTKRL